MVLVELAVGVAAGGALKAVAEVCAIDGSQYSPSFFHDYDASLRCMGPSHHHRAYNLNTSLCTHHCLRTVWWREARRVEKAERERLLVLR